MSDIQSCKWCRCLAHAAEVKWSLLSRSHVTICNFDDCSSAHILSAMGSLTSSKMVFKDRLLKYKPIDLVLLSRTSERN